VSWVCACVCVHVYVCARVCACVCAYRYMFAHYVCVRVCVCVCVRAYVCIHAHRCTDRKIDSNKQRCTPVCTFVRVSVGKREFARL